MSARVAEIVAEATRLAHAAEAHGTALRLLGGVAVRLRCPDAASRPELARVYNDIDLAAPKRASRTIRDMLARDGYAPNSQFNALHGASRLLFYDQEYGRQVDVFLGSFAMCHKLDLEPRLAMAGPALPPSDLLLLKLQIVELNEKDVTDALALLLQYAPVAVDGSDTISTAYIARLCAGDWGWYTTLRDNVEAVRARAPAILKERDGVARVQAGADALLAAMETAPKSVGWRLRDKIGRRKVWYELPEEVER